MSFLPIIILVQARLPSIDVIVSHTEGRLLARAGILRIFLWDMIRIQMLKLCLYLLKRKKHQVKKHATLPSKATLASMRAEHLLYFNNSRI